MVQCHALVLLAPASRTLSWFGWVGWADGLIAPAFLLCAGISAGLAVVAAARAGARVRRLGRALVRIAQVLGISTLMASFFWNVIDEPKWLLRIDVLACVGLSLLAGWLFALPFAHRPRWLAGLSVTFGAALLLGAARLSHVEGTSAAFLGNSSGSVFPLVPWGAHLFAGLGLGALLGSGIPTARATLGLSGLGALLWLLARQLEPLNAPHDPWSEAAPHFARWIQLPLLLLALERLATTTVGERLGRLAGPLSRCSLTAYFVHETWLYTPRLVLPGLVAMWGEGSLEGPAYLAATAGLLTATWAACVAVERFEAARS